MGKRFFRHGELHLVILSLLQVRPMHGYELMGELERLFANRYRPSAGSIYPAIESLEAEGLIEGESVESRRVFRVTRSGQSAIEKRKSRLAELEVRTGVRLSPIDGTEAALARFTARVRATAPQIAADELDEFLEKWASEIETHIGEEQL